MDPVVLTGRIEYLSLKERDRSPEGLDLRKTYARLARLLVTGAPAWCGAEAGDVVLVGFEFTPPAFVRRGAVVRLRAVPGPASVWRVLSPSDAAPQCTADDLEVLARADLNLSPAEEAALRGAFGAVRLSEVYSACLADREAFEGKAAAVLGAERAREVADALERIAGRADLSRLCSMMVNPEVGFDLPKAVAVYEALKRRAALAGTTVADMVADDPWLIAQVEDVDFRDADQLAKVLGKRLDDPKRIVGAAMHVLQEAARNGDAYVPFGEAYYRVTALVNNSRIRRAEDVAEDELPDEDEAFRLSSEDVKDVLGEELRKEKEWREGARGKPGARRMPKEFVVRGKIRADSWRKDEVVEVLKAWQRANPDSAYASVKADGKGAGLCLGGVFTAERWAAQKLAEFLASPPRPVSAERLRDRAHAAARRACGRPLDTSQVDALYKAAAARLAVVCGPAGTGKTLLMTSLAAAFEEAGLSVAQFAATGAAAQRLEARSGRPCCTVHRGIALQRDAADLALDHADIEELRQAVSLGADVVMVDEATMLDVYVFQRLLDAVIRPGARIILFGDDAQLGAVGPGMPFSDLLRLAEELGSACPYLKAARLDTDHRNQTPAARNAALIRSGIPLLENIPARPGGGGFELRQAPPGGVDAVLEDLLDGLAAEGVPPQDILVLCRRKGGRADAAGTEQLNLYLQQKFNPDGQPVDPMGLSPFRVGDPVICIENDYPEFRRNGVRRRPVVYNGTIGVVRGSRFAEGVDGVDDGRVLVEVEYPLAAGGTFSALYTLDEAYRYLRLAYALTVHKAQGAEAPVVVFVEYDLRAARLTRNLLYTAVTRAKQVPGKPWSGRVYLIGPADPEGGEGWAARAVKNPQRPRYTRFFWRAKERLAGERREAAGGEEA